MENNEEYLKKCIGKKIKLARARTNYTQEKLAERLEISERYIARIERGESGLKISTLVKICKILDIEADKLLFE